MIKRAALDCRAGIVLYCFGHAKIDFCSAGTAGYERRMAMPDFNPFDMDLAGDVDGIDFPGFE